MEITNKTPYEMDEYELKRELTEARELIKKLYNYMGISADSDHKLWRETQVYCREKGLVK